MSEECRLELWAESIAPSSTCAQLQGTWILAMLTRASAVGAQGGGVNGATSSAGPNQAQTKPPHSCTGQARCCTRSARPLAAGSETISCTWPSTSNFQPW